MKIQYAIFTLIIFCCITAYGQSKKAGHSILGKKHAETELKLALSGKEQHNVVNSETIVIKDSLTAIAIAEPILFGVYGQSNIVKQKPYEIYHISNYWVLSGTLPKDMCGGTFLIIINDRNSQVIKITHGK